jgi:nitrate/nitrite-specific signal transduction histidine kinase
MKRRTVITHGLTVGIASLGFAGYVAPVLAQVTSLNDAINKAGRQRMLVQRMAKSYMALGIGAAPSEADKVLTASIGLFERQLAELKVFAPRPEIQITYQQLEAKWSAYKAALVGKMPSQQGALEILAIGNEVLFLANQGTLQLEKISSKPAGKLVNIAGRQRMLSQRMASYYLASSWNIDAQKSKVEMLKARDEFILAMDVLKSAPETTPRTAEELTLAEQQFVFFQAALQNVQTASSDKRPQIDVFRTSERILQVMDNITNLYSQIS